MKIDLKGRIRNTNLAASHYLMPVFEAVINSIYAIEEARIADGRIDIHVKRSQDQLALDNCEILRASVESFIVVDNGIGFNDVNYDSFCTADSTHKIDKGGKGVGRLTWLKAFDYADIESHYLGENGVFSMRKFKFSDTADGIENYQLGASSSSERKTTVKLGNYRAPYRDKCPRPLKIIATRIIEHCLIYFVFENCPPIFLHDDDGSVIDLGMHFERGVKKFVEREDFELNGRHYRLTHLKLDMSSDVGQKITFCAHNRAVVLESLQNKIQGMPPSFKETDSSSFVYAGYLSGSQLDEKVNIERTDFNIPRKRGDLDLNTDPSWEEILSSSYNRIGVFLDSYTRPLNEANLARIRQYIEQKAPTYRPLLKHKVEELKKIPHSVCALDDKLDLELHRIYSLYENDLKAKFKDLLTKANYETLESIHSQINGFIDEWNEDGKAKLSNHVAYRKATLLLLETIIGRTENGFSLEKTIHNLIFPMKVTSRDVSADNVNLWIIDERLSYHSYLASDIAFGKMQEELIIEGKDRPDLLIFQTANMFVEDRDALMSMVIVEFKRPMREDFTESENPISQIYNYIEKINSGTAIDTRGRRISIPTGMPYYAYIIADLTPNLARFAERAQLTPTYDKKGYFGFLPNHKCYMEIISFDKLVSDAQKRNAILFDKLGIQ